MSVYTNNNITRRVDEEIPAYRLVVSKDGGISLAGADDTPFGAVTEAGNPEPQSGLPQYLRVHAGQGVVPVETDGTGFTEGDTVYVGANGKVAKTGNTPVGVADGTETTRGAVKTVRVNLFHPQAA